LRLNLPVPQRLQLSGQAPSTWNNSSGAFACALLAPQSNPSLSHAARLAVTGIAS
jgi:hypothetical protein